MAGEHADGLGGRPGAQYRRKRGDGGPRVPGRKQYGSVRCSGSARSTTAVAVLGEQPGHTLTAIANPGGMRDPRVCLRHRYSPAPLSRSRRRTACPGRSLNTSAALSAARNSPGVLVQGPSAARNRSSRVCARPLRGAGLWQPGDHQPCPRGREVIRVLASAVPPSCPDGGVPPWQDDFRAAPIGRGPPGPVSRSVLISAPNRSERCGGRTGSAARRRWPGGQRGCRGPSAAGVNKNSTRFCLRGGTWSNQPSVHAVSALLSPPVSRSRR